MTNTGGSSMPPLGAALFAFRMGMPSTFGVSFLVVLIAFLLFDGALP